MLPFIFSLYVVLHMSWEGTTVLDIFSARINGRGFEGISDRLLAFSWPFSHGLFSCRGSDWYIYAKKREI